MAINKANAGVWCDYCKAIYGKKNGSWLPQATTQAVCTAVSETKLLAGNSRSYCSKHLLQITGAASVTEAIMQLVDDSNYAKEVLGV